MPSRTPIEQTFFNFSISVPNTPVPLSSQIQVPSLITSIILSNPSSNANSVFMGDQNVTTLTGIEITVGSAPILSLAQERQLYEVQDPMLLAAQTLACQKTDAIQIPLVVFNPQKIFLIAGVAGPTIVACMMFRSVYS